MSEEQQTAETRTAEPGGRVASPSVRVGDKVGRFSILSELGAGGMGQVYQAYDPQLDRRIALKLLHASGEEGHRQRLVREAQALARLDHPNVVTVHDVGTHEGALFVAMEFVPGGTLKDWMANNPVAGGEERFDNAIRLLLDAGRGLVAAHEAGLVHRDVKPSNILIGEDGRARVADFGIAYTLEATRSRPKWSAASHHVLLSTEESGQGLTRTGTLIGTPAYMAPEQFGGRVNAAADQFSYCVTAWEVLFGVRPFGETDARARLSAIRNGELRKPEGVEVDARVVELLGRGLRHRAPSRHRRLDTLVRALARATGQDADSARRPVRGWALLTATIGVLGAAAAYRIGEAEQLCTGAAAAWEEVWDDTRRERTRSAVLGSKTDFAPGAWRRLEAGLDAYGRNWQAARSDACQATRIRDEQSTRRMEERLACLEDAKRSVNALVELVSSGEAGVLANERGLLEGLAKVEDCAEVRSLPTKAELATLEGVARSAAQRNAGHAREALRIVEPLAQRLDETTSPSVRARVLLEYGRGIANTDPRRAIGVLEESYSAAHAAAERPAAAAAARELAHQHIRLRDKVDVVRDWLQLAKSEGRQDSSAEHSELLGLEGALLVLSGRHAEATSTFEESVAAARGSDAQLPSALRLLAVHLTDIDPDRSLEVAGEALERFRTSFGPGHPGLATFEETLAGALARRGRRDEAEMLAERALERVTRTWGRDSVATSRYLVRLAQIKCSQVAEGEHGTKSAERAVALHPATSSSPARYEALLALDTCVRSRDAERAMDVSEQLLSLSKQLYGEENFRTTRVRAMRAVALLQRSRVAAARREVRSATTLAHENAAGWDRRDAIHVHSVLARLSSDLRIETTPVEHGRATLVLARTTESAAELAPNLDRNLCSAKRLVGDLQGALEHCLAALERTDKQARPLEYARLEYETGGSLNELSRHADALPHAKAAETAFADNCGAQSYYAALAALELAVTHEGIGEHAAAEQSFEKSFEVFQSFKAAKRAQLEAGSGVARMMALRGDPTGALALLNELAELVGGRHPIDRGRLSESRGFVLHARDHQEGAREYTRALADYRFSHYMPGVRRVCRTAPFALRGCGEAPLLRP